MPSLVEGFGQVYLEALAHGCPVLGTSNSGLPDLGSEADGIFLVSPGHVEELSEQLERLSQLLPSDHKIRRAAHACAGRFTWQAFRMRVRQKLVNSFPCIKTAA
jgi:glycosyltransferase involved in cell wall biosynthesis